MNKQIHGSRETTGTAGGSEQSRSSPGESEQSSTAERIRESGIEKVQQAGERARSGIDEGRQQLVDRMHRITSALHSMSDELGDEDQMVSR